MSYQVHLFQPIHQMGPSVKRCIPATGAKGEENPAAARKQNLKN
jgi:hypothetical protein